MKKYVYIGMLLFIAFGVKAQVEVSSPGSANTLVKMDRQVVASGGGYCVTSQGVSFQHCFGEVIVQSLIQPNQLLTQGFEQPHLLINRFSEITKSKTFELILYPNPTSYLTKVKFVLKQPAKVKVVVMDGLGRILNSFSKNYELGAVEIPIDVKHLAIGGYYVQVYINNEKYERKLLIE
ncbi:T9SS type A sorting domain-containing protein [Solitalea canadensis]|uniref:Secretion system C-terminal sorting domain-containing protein n=1 Tax=Solitalea canadensis (strain ATCC 29591 / DSM 3403 / JCM 21819 / LMG 8368 / NBRC 15130 / NCIMB 12057 / USAM 9D) TaxID=929556 RepID=H8KTG4_SOLCM|nr:T9SS type A sorting domain-containing protein [Solitalea canadensis]AFD06301.1 hypothetical protein Solca_1201 [Solitalea canadensis DSM 3403]